MTWQSHALSFNIPIREGLVTDEVAAQFTLLFNREHGRNVTHYFIKPEEAE